MNYSRRITGQRTGTSLHGHCSRHTVQYTNRRIAGQRSSLHGLGSRHIGTSLRVSSQCSSLHGPCSHNILVVALLISILVYMGIVPGIQYTSRRIAGQRSSLQGHYSRQILVLAILFSVLVYMDSFPAYTSRRITGRVLVYKGLFSAYTSRRITSQRSSLQGHCFRHKLL